MEQSLKRQVSDLKEELGSINMTDEFAKYSKIQRKLIKVTDELKNKNCLSITAWFFISGFVFRMLVRGFF
ncbi:tail-anchored protein insertion receptor WRB-like protein [Euroglyphus maynei]|uniref:Guided entry of tail-anchored proteins factor 1 n=1 Tax=Euroglyphus maynei TaxID=6958 RepID=A0A1Y3BK76_EURMA|nr:tail-anchored protein insertion receptor WRB-like protein [Euroglyphus maynei]